jgi:hypothetical protein
MSLRRATKERRRQARGKDEPFLNSIRTLGWHVAVRTRMQAAQVRSLIVYSLED